MLPSIRGSFDPQSSGPQGSGPFNIQFDTTSTYGLEPTHCNRLLVEPSGWAQTVHTFILRCIVVCNTWLNIYAVRWMRFSARLSVLHMYLRLAEPYLISFRQKCRERACRLTNLLTVFCDVSFGIVVKDKSLFLLMVDRCYRFVSLKAAQKLRQSIVQCNHSNPLPVLCFKQPRSWVKG